MYASLERLLEKESKTNGGRDREFETAAFVRPLVECRPYGKDGKLEVINKLLGEIELMLY